MWPRRNRPVLQGSPASPAPTQPRLEFRVDVRLLQGPGQHDPTSTIDVELNFVPLSAEPSGAVHRNRIVEAVITRLQLNTQLVSGLHQTGRELQFTLNVALLPGGDAQAYLANFIRSSIFASREINLTFTFRRSYAYYLTSAVSDNTHWAPPSAGQTIWVPYYLRGPQDETGVHVQAVAQQPGSPELRFISRDGRSQIEFDQIHHRLVIIFTALKRS